MPRRVRRDPRRPAGGYNYPQNPFANMPYQIDASGNAVPWPWQGPSTPATATTAPAANPPAAAPPPVTGGFGYAPPPVTYAPPPATTAVPGPWSIPASAPATNTGGGPAPANQGNQGGDPLGPGANGFYSQKEFWDTLAGYSDGNWHGEGWYGSNGNWSPTLQGLQNQGDWAGDGTDRAIGYNPTYGMNTVGGGASSGANYQGGRRGRSGWLEGLGIDPYQNMLGNQEVRRQIRAQFPSKRGGGHTPPAGLIGNQSGAQGGGGGTTPNWMGTMVGFNP